jgi:thiol-disulfide isomerase/thioredoxin
MNTYTIATFIGIACIATNALAQDHPDHPDSVPAIPLEKPTVAVKEEKLPPPTPLFIGDKAPAVTVDYWVKGDAWDGFDDGQVYVMEFWATWCGPCISSMPHLSGLQDEYGDKVQIIGVSSEKDPEIVTTFLEKTNNRDNKVNNDRMRYTVAVDPDRSTSRAYMEASNQRGIPTSFIVNGEGQVAWIGHPMTMDEPLKEIVAGTWDLAAAAEAFKIEAQQEKAMSELNKVYRSAMETEDWDSWITAIDEYIATYGNNNSIDNAKFKALLNLKKDKKAAYAWANKMALGIWNNSQALNALAWGIVDETPEELQDLNFALKIATRASDLTQNKDPMILDTLARCYWKMGNTYKAIAWQEKAVGYMNDENMNASIKATLNEYKATLANVDE